LLFGTGYKYYYLLTYPAEYSIRYSIEYSHGKKPDSPSPRHHGHSTHCATRQPSTVSSVVTAAIISDVDKIYWV